MISPPSGKPAYAGHHSRRPKASDTWLTPLWLMDRLGRFDLDPCAHDQQPQPTAKVMVTASEDGLRVPWGSQFVWCNPPYGSQAEVWVRRMAAHNNGIALLFARTDTRMFQDHVWPRASALLFLRGRLRFLTPSGDELDRAPAPSVLVGYGSKAAERLSGCSDLGALVAGPCGLPTG